MLRSLRISRSPLVSLAGFAVRRPVLALVLSLGLCTLASLGALQVQLATSVASLLPHGSPVLDRFSTLEETFGATDVLFLAVESGPDEAAAAHRAELVDHLAERLADWTWDPPGEEAPEPVIGGMVGTRDDALAPAVKRWFAHHGWLLLDEAGRARLFGYLEQPKALAKKLSRDPNVPPVHLEDALAYDPLGAFAETLGALSDSAAGSVAFDRQGYLISADGTFHVVLLHATRQSQDSAFCKDLVTGIHAIEAEIAADPRWDGLTLHAVGGYFIAHRDYQEAFSSGWVTLVTSMLGVLLLFGIAYRSLRLAFLIAICLLPALGAALGAASALLRLILEGSDLSMIVTGFAAILIGLGVDFFIHIYNAYGWALHERLDGTSGPTDRAGRRRLRGEAALAAVERVGGGIAAAACTSIATFLVLLLSHYRGMWELGAVCGIGLLIILFQVMLAAPAFLTLAGSLKVRPSHLLNGLAGSLVTRPRAWGTALVTLLISAGVYLAFQPELFVFERDPRKLRPAHDEIYLEQVTLANRLGLDQSGHQLLLWGQDPVEILGVAHHITQRLEPLTHDLSLQVGGSEPVLVTDGLPVPVAIEGGSRAAIGRRAAFIGERELLVAGIDGEHLLLRAPPGHQPIELRPGTSLRLAATVANLPPELQVLPSPQHQQDVLERAAALDWPAIEAAIASLPAAERAKRSEFLAGLATMRERASDHRLLLPHDLADTPLEGLVDQVYREIDGEIRMRMPINLIDKDPSGLQDLLPALELDPQGGGQIGGVTFGTAGAPSIALAIQRLLEIDFHRLALLALAATSILVLVGLRSLRGAIQAICALSGGLVLALATMHLLGLDWNLMNISVLPLIIGIGIDNGIHFVHALRHSHLGGVAAVRQAINETGHPIVMTALTSMVGFGSLMLNGFRGIQSVGLTAVIGIAACLVVSLIGLPLLALWLVKRHETRLTMKPMPAESRVD